MKKWNEWYNENCSSTWRFKCFNIWVTKTVQNELKKQKGGLLSMLLGTLGARLLGNLLTGKGIYRARKGEGIIRAGYGNNKMDF